MVRGIRFNFQTNDIDIGSDGAIVKAVVDNQLCALIALSQICRLTRPELGAQLAGRLQNRKQRSVAAYLSEAERMVRRDGGQNVSIRIDVNEQLTFNANYDS